jgi:hypothetical protein
MNLTHVLFKHEAISFIKGADDQYRVLAGQPITKGTLLLLEHVLSGKPEFVLGGIGACPRLFAELYPRTDMPDASQKMTFCRDKLDHNAFSFDGDNVVGAAFSKFNHSCQPNVYMSGADQLTCHINRTLTVTVHIYGLWALQDIAAGTELYVDYVNGGGPDVHERYTKHFGFVCGPACDAASIAQGPQRTSLYASLCADYRNRDILFINRNTDVYTRMPETKARMKAHFLGTKGYFESGDDVYVMNENDPNPKRSILKWKLRMNAK